MIRHGLFYCLLMVTVSICYVKSAGDALLIDLSTLIPPCTGRELVEAVPRSLDVIVYFHDRHKDGSYVFAYILKNGVRRYERAHRDRGQLNVEGFFSFRKTFNSRYVYETTRYTAGKDGYYPKKVEVTYDPPKIPNI